MGVQLCSLIEMGRNTQEVADARLAPASTGHHGYHSQIQQCGVDMSSQLEAVEAQALKLTAEERAELADRLIASLFEDSEIEEAWAVEVERRIAEIESGRAQTIPAAEAIARARAAIK